MSERWVDLDGADNVRDLGGLPTTDGRVTRFGALLRSSTVQLLTPDATAWLRDSYGLRTVLDLRTPKEAAAEGRGALGLEDIDYYNIPFVPDEYLDPADPRHEVVVRARKEGDQVDAYLDYITRGGNVARALRLVATGGSTPLLFHCAAGKDRTGVLAALVLDIAGVDRDAILGDYLATNERLEHVLVRLSTLATYGGLAVDPGRIEKVSRDARCREDTIPRLLAGLDERYGGTAAWATSAGVTDEELERLRWLLVG